MPNIVLVVIDKSDFKVVESFGAAVLTALLCRPTVWLLLAQSFFFGSIVY